MGFSPQAYWSGLPFPPLVDHILPELSTVTWPSWVALHGLAHSFTELHKPLCRDKVVIHEGDTPGILLQFVFYSTLYLLRPIHINPCRENYFIYLIFGGSLCFTQAIFSCSEQGILLIEVHGLLLFGVQALGMWASVTAAHSLSICNTQAW